MIISNAMVCTAVDHDGEESEQDQRANEKRAMAGGEENISDQAVRDFRNRSGGDGSYQC
jgi:hypothetical protein